MSGAAKWTIEFYTVGSSNDNSRGDDWTIYRAGVEIFYEGRDALTAGEARQLFALASRAGWWGEFNEVSDDVD